MNSDLVILDPNKITDISKQLLLENGKVKLLPYQEWLSYTWEDFRFFCHQHARYGIPTRELVELIKNIIGARSAIEIGAGAGDLGYHLGIPMTDSRIQEEGIVRAMYEKMGQPIIKYGIDVEKLESLEAVKKYKPQVVLASWVTTFSPRETTFGSSPYGVKEKDILDLVETYILVGNLNFCGDKPIMKLPHSIIEAPHIISRSINKEGNRVWVWDKRDVNQVVCVKGEER